MLSKKFSKGGRGTVCSSAAETVSEHKSSKIQNLRVLFVLIVLSILFFTSCTNFKTQSQFDKNLQELPTLTPYRIADKWGFCDRNKKMIIQPVYDDARPFSDGLAAVELNDKWGYIDTKANMVIKPVYDAGCNMVGLFSDGLAAVELNGKWGFIDDKGKMVI